MSSPPSSLECQQEGLTPSEGTYTISLSDKLGVRLYADCRPYNLKIAQLQKGLLLLWENREVVEEGAGFGVPVAVFSDQTYFTSSATTYIHRGDSGLLLEKRYILDSITEKKWRNRVFRSNRLQKLVSDSIEKTYRDHPIIRNFILPLINVRNRLGIMTTFTKTKPRGEVTVFYRLSPNCIGIKADFTKLEKRGLKKIVLLNEQGSHFFRKLKINNSSLLDEAIGEWRLIIAAEVCLSDQEETLVFQMQNLPNCQLFVGRECIAGLLAWVGLEYEISRNSDFVEYNILLRDKSRA
ncbi:hypothetical protein MUO79_10135 [Candidatus Bathyarchaeota archaeon]|nr:hypothetical protein [Candidatus Bathyarchaeota archaeon]